MYHRLLFSSFTPDSFTLAKIPTRQIRVAITTIILAVSCAAQDQPQAQPASLDSQRGTQSLAASAPVTLHPGTRIPLVLTHDLRSRSMRRGDDIYAQTTSPVTSGNQMVIPPGTFVQGTVDKLDQKKGRAELHLQSMSIIFPDGYAAPVAGPLTMQSDEGYALKDPGSGRGLGIVALPAVGVGLGALIGHSAASSQSTTITNSLPPGCVGLPPECLSSSLTVPPNKGKATVIGAAVGGAIGVAASLVLLSSSHNFFLQVGTPVELVLQQPLSLQQAQVLKTIQQSAEQPVTEQPIEPRPVAAPHPNTDPGTCYTPGTPRTPPTVIPGTPGPDGISGPPSTIPGTAPTAGTPYPCP